MEAFNCLLFYNKGHTESIFEELIVCTNNFSKMESSLEVVNTFIGDNEMKNIRKRNNNLYEYRKTDFTGKRISIYAKTLTELKEKIYLHKQKTKKLLRNNTQETQKEKTSYKFNDYILNWYETFRLPNLKEKSQESWNNSIKNYIIPYFKDYNIKNLTAQQCQKFLNGINASRTKEIIFIHLKAFLVYCFGEGLLKKDITKNLTVGKYKKQTRTALNIEEQGKLLQLLENHEYKILIYFYLITGCRRNEILEITKADINFQENSLYINGTKTSSAKRLIKISEEFKLMLKQICEESKTKYLFNNLYAKKISNLVTELLDKIGVKGSTHILRHTAVTNMYYLGIKEKQIQQIVGHANVSITRNIYTHLSPETTRNKLLKLYNNLYPTYE